MERMKGKVRMVVCTNNHAAAWAKATRKDTLALAAIWCKEFFAALAVLLGWAWVAIALMAGRC